MKRTEICAADDVPLGRGKVFPAGTKKILLIREGESVVGYRDFCPHAGGTLKYDGKRITCVRHGATFDPKTDEGQTAPAVGLQLQREDVHIEDGKVVLYEEESRSPWVMDF